VTAWPGRNEFVRRLTTNVLVVLAFAQIGNWPWFVIIAIGALAVLVYSRFPREPRPKDALCYDVASSQTIPDWMGFILSGFFIGLPIWGARAEPVWGPIHPSAVMVWPMALFSTAFWLVGAVYAPHWITIEPKGLRIHSAFADRRIAFSDIQRVRPYKRNLPQWLLAMAPVFAAAGKFSLAGALMLSRPRRGMTLELADGRRVAIASDGFADGYREIREVLAVHGVRGIRRRRPKTKSHN